MVTALPNIDQIVAMYWEADRSSVQQRFESLFGHNPEEQRGGSNDGFQDEAGETDEGDEATHTPLARANIPPDPDAEFEAILAELQISERIREMLRAAWENLNRSKPLAIHYIDCLFGKSFTPEHALEGLVACFGIGPASHFCFPFLPELSFPVDRDALSYEKLRTILGILGIEYVDAENLLPSTVWLNISIAVEEYREQHELRDWQMWALVYDLGPRLLSKPGPYPVDPPPRIWVAATNNRFGQFEKLDQIDSEYIDGWAINPKARRGDLALMYCVSPRSALVSIHRSATRAHRDPFGGWNGHFADLTEKIPIPWITFAEMKADPVMKEWKLVRGNFQGLLHYEVPQEVWERIKQIVAEKDPEAGERLAQYANAAEGVRMIKVSGEKWSELEVEEKLVIPLLDQLGWKVDRTVVRQVEMDIKIGSGKPKRVYADFVGYSDALSSEPLLVVEAKRRLGNDTELKRAVEQAECYAGKLRCSRFAVAAPEGFWVYDLKFPGQSAAIATIPMDAAASSGDIGKLRPLIGYDALRAKEESKTW
jgi:hypothetical protein